MTVSLPTFRKVGSSFIRVPDSTGITRAASLLDKHSATIAALRERLGFHKDETVIAWLLEQIEMSPDLDGLIAKMLEE